ncbi:MAG: hypothetical protein IKD45_04170 [Clostridia bacterium]|nr:hypothetical protein [Clostridia bacterium]
MNFNKEAMEALEKGDFYGAQCLFRKAVEEAPTYQAYNNLGNFYISEGVCISNERGKSGARAGKQMLRKSIKIKKTPTALNNLAMAEYKANNYSKALGHWLDSYELSCNPSVLYNVAVIYFLTEEYRKCADICEKIIDVIPLAKSLLTFAVCMYDKAFIKDTIADEARTMDFSEPIDKLYIYYFTEQYSEVISAHGELYSLGMTLPNDDLPMLLDSYIKCGIREEGINAINAQYLDHDTSAYSAYYSRIKRNISKMARKPYFLKRALRKLKYYPEIIDDECGYFGCELHSTPWE